MLPDKKILSNIEATLTDGKAFVNNRWKAVFIVAVVLCSVLFICMIMLIIGMAFYGFDHESVVVVLGMSATLILCSVGVIIIGYFMAKWRKSISLWLNDAVVLEAYCKKIETGVDVRFPMIVAQTSAIEVAFFYNNIRHIKRSEHNGKPLYLHVFNKFIDKTIRILYSPKYDKVMLLNPGKDISQWQ